jgi:EAL and modified HD-GYP domain-containing signal transduction protein
VPTIEVMFRALRTAEPALPGPLGDAPDASEVAVVRLPVADVRGTVSGYELVFAHADGRPPASVNARATAAMLCGAFADIGLDRLTGRHPAWLSVARDFLVAVGLPPVRPDRVVIQVAAYAVQPDLMAILRVLSESGYTLAVTDYEGADEGSELLDVCSVVKLPFDRLAPSRQLELVQEVRERGAQPVATGVHDEDALELCRSLGIGLVQGSVLAEPRIVLGRNVASSAGSTSALRTLAELSSGDLSFDDVERIVAADFGLSLKLLRYVNSAFFALPREVGSVREALALLGSRTVQRWAMVVVMADAAETPDALVTLALQRGRMCETLAAAIAPEDQATCFTIGMFSVADALLGLPMEEVLAELPFSEEVRTALLRREGPKGRVLAAVLAYERGEFPELRDILGDAAAASDAYRDAVEWADGATQAALSVA